MKNNSLILPALLLTASMFITAELISFSAGAPTNASGAPSTGSLNTCVQCHSSNNNERLNWITTTELNNGYVAGNQYNMRAKAEKSGCTKFGFLITVEKLDGTKGGPPVVTDASRTQISNTHFITHTPAGTAGQDSAVWNFKWNAPATPIGTVTFYGAFIGANADNLNTGDVVYVSKKVVILYGTQGIAIPSRKQGNKAYLFPNPADQFLNLDLETPVSNAVLTIFDLKGQVIREVTWEQADHMLVDVSSLPNGTYLTRLNWNNDQINAKFIINRP